MNARAPHLVERGEEQGVRGAAELVVWPPLLQNILVDVLCP
jgi:hypothetical protein